MYPKFRKKIETVETQDIIALLLLVATALFFCWKSHFSIGHDDESWYLTFPLRLTMGDSPLVDEWHLGQLFGFLLYLPVKAYLYIVGSTEGIVLFFRYMYIAFQGTVSTFIYCRLRKYGSFSIIVAIAYFSFIPLTIMALSYNSMGLAFVVLIGVMMFTTRQFSKVNFYVTGVFLACAVLCNPTLVIMYFVYSICVVVYEKTKNKKHRPISFTEVSFSAKTWLWVTLGVATTALLFFAFLFSRTTLSEIISNLPMLFTDPDYVLSGGQNVFNLTDSVLKIVKYDNHVFLAYVFVMALIAFDKKRIPHRSLYLMATCIIFFFYFLSIIPSGSIAATLSIYHGTYSTFDGIPCLLLMFPLTLLGLTSYVLTEKKDKGLFVFLWLLGILYTFCLDISSDFAPWTSAFGFAVSAIASILFIKNIIDEIRIQIADEKYTKQTESKKKLMQRATMVLLVSALALQIGSQFYMNASLTKNNMEYLIDPPSEKLSVLVETGPLKGLRTTARVEKLYNTVINDLSVIKEDGEGAVLVTNNYAWCSLYLNMPYASYNPFITDWFIASQYRLPKYYELHPDKTPSYIYVFKMYDTFYDLVPVRAEEIVADIHKKYDCTVIKESTMGYVVKIIK